MRAALFKLYNISDKDHGRWLNLPWYVRVGMGGVGWCGLAGRGVDLLSLSQFARASDLGHIDLIGLGVSASMAFLFVGLVVYASRSSLSRNVRAGVTHLEEVAHGPNGEAMAEMMIQRSDLTVPLGALANLEAQGVRVVRPRESIGRTA